MPEMEFAVAKEPLRYEPFTSGTRGAFCVYQGDQLVGAVRNDSKSGQWIAQRANGRIISSEMRGGLPKSFPTRRDAALALVEVTR